ncbi:hypothetical protein WMY93_029531 [Mugilogobius chulae]|uniref:Uncharacterized protein n=1 Tax=Mugilogobius chulae TaxID=88201 RepID=A0AAW0MPP5_9GOBI
MQSEIEDLESRNTELTRSHNETLNQLNLKIQYLEKEQEIARGDKKPRAQGRKRGKCKPAPLTDKRAGGSLKKALQCQNVQTQGGLGQGNGLQNERIQSNNGRQGFFRKNNRRGFQEQPNWNQRQQQSTNVVPRSQLDQSRTEIQKLTQEIQSLKSLTKTLQEENKHLKGSQQTQELQATSKQGPYKKENEDLLKELKKKEEECNTLTRKINVKLALSGSQKEPVSNGKTRSNMSVREKLRRTRRA